MHIGNNSFGKGVTSVKFNVLNVDQFASDIHFFFKLSVARRADYHKVTNVTNAIAEYILRHSLEHLFESSGETIEAVVRRCSIKNVFS